MDRKLFLKTKPGNWMKASLNFTDFPSASFHFQLKENLSINMAYSNRIERTTTFKMNPFLKENTQKPLARGPHLAS